MTISTSQGGHEQYGISHQHYENNIIFWGTTPPENALQRPLHLTKCTA